MHTYNKLSLSLITLVVFFTGCGENAELIAKKKQAMCDIAAHKLGYPILINKGRIVTFDSGDRMIYLRRDGGKSQWGIHCKFEETFTIVTMVKDVINDNGDYSWLPNGSKRFLTKDLEP